jgi:hypothetical protein
MFTRQSFVISRTGPSLQISFRNGAKRFTNEFIGDVMRGLVQRSTHSHYPKDANDATKILLEMLGLIGRNILQQQNSETNNYVVLVNGKPYSVPLKQAREEALAERAAEQKKLTDGSI